jgi:hypothetical protein
MRRPLLIAGAALLAGALFCRYVVADRWLPRIPPGWRSASSYVGTMTYPDSVTGVLPEQDVLSVYERSMAVVSDAGRPDSITVEDVYTMRDVFSRSVIWEYKTRAVVDPATGARLEPAYRGDYVVFPRNVQKGEYRLRTSYVNGIPLRYESTEKLDGLETYVFGYTGRGEYTESYAGSADFAGIKTPRGQEIRCADDQFSYRVWVEPVTGAIVKLAEGCPSGDYVFDSATGKRLQAIGRWGGVTSGNALARQLEESRHQRVARLWAGTYGPLGLGGAALVLLGFGIRPRRRSKSA